MNIVEAIERAEQAFVRRFGHSLASLHFSERDHKTLRVFDPENGAWADYDFSGWRIRRVAEFDPVDDG